MNREKSIATYISALKVQSVSHPNETTFTNWQTEICGRWSYEQLRSDSHYRRSWISFDAVAYSPVDKRIHLGLSVLAGASIHWVYDPTTHELSSLGFEAVGDDYDAKIHRNIHFFRRKAYFGTALYHDAPQQREAHGGKLVAYDFDSRTYDVLGVPCPHNYIQSTALDKKREIIYSLVYPSEQLVRFDIRTRESRPLCWLGNTRLLCQPHNPVLDSEGNLWATWGEVRAWDEVSFNTLIRFLKYNPDSDEITWYEHGAPKIDSLDQGQVDGFVLGPDDLIYGGTCRGTFFRFDPRNAEVEDLGKPSPEIRLSAMATGPDGFVYGAGGFNFWVFLFRFDPAARRWETLGQVVDSNTGERCERAHDMDISPEGVIYIGENDTHHRTARLWICSVSE